MYRSIGYIVSLSSRIRETFQIFYPTVSFHQFIISRICVNIFVIDLFNPLILSAVNVESLKSFNIIFYLSRKKFILPSLFLMTLLINRKKLFLIYNRIDCKRFGINHLRMKGSNVEAE